MKSRQRGATAIEFALVLVIFLTFLLAVVDFGRLLFTWNAAIEATRAGARYAVVCDSTANQAAVLARMQGMLPQISAIQMTWVPAGCNSSTCEGVTVAVTGVTHAWISPVFGLASVAPITIPPFSTYLTREVMRQDPNSNTIC